MNRREFIASAVVGGGILGAGMLSGETSALGASATGDEKKAPSKRGLIMYASRTNNTTKVGERFKGVLERNGWSCDICKIEQNSDPMAFPYSIKDYDLVCAGTGIRMHAPYIELLHVIRAPVYGYDPRIMYKMTEGVKLSEEETKKMQAGGAPQHGKIVIGPDAKKAFSFATYGGFEFGPGEVQQALDWINVELAHLHLDIVGKFCCPGRMGNITSPTGYHDDLPNRPNEKDLLRAELFMEQILESISDRSAKSA